MENNDFEGAQKMAKRAQSIYPELENIMQLINICDVHCSSKKRVLGSDKDWYAILQVDWLADQLTIKKQYRRLALFLHPDKNRFPGAESAFKLICEANAGLSDPVKKCLYDNKIKASTASVPANAPTLNINKKYSQFTDKSRSQNSVYSNLSRHHAAQSSSSTRLDAFWTACLFCRTKYQCQRQFVNRFLLCQKCSVYFMAYEESAEGVSSESKQGQHGHMEGKRSNEDAGARELDLKNRGRKRSWKQAAESCESLDEVRRSDAINMAAGVGCGDTATEMDSGPVRVLTPQRSSWKRQHVIHNESDGNLTSPHQASHERKLPEDNTEEQNDSLDGENSRHCNQNSFPTAVFPSKEK